jgi:hypothetical protein
VDGDANWVRRLRLPQEHGGAGQLPLLVSPTIANIKLYHVLINGGAALNLISLVAFKKLQILMGKLQPSRHSLEWVQCR